MVAAEKELQKPSHFTNPYRNESIVKFSGNKLTFSYRKAQAKYTIQHSGVFFYLF